MTKEAYQDALFRKQGKKRTDCFEKATVAVCGLGGLGSNISLMLARSGVGTLILVDQDEVELSNIHRQQYRLSQIGKKKTDSIKELIEEVNPYCRVKTKTICVNEENVRELVKEADVVCEAFDKPENKAMLVNAVRSYFPEKPLVAASGMAGFAEANAIRTRKLSEDFVLCGDGKSDVATAGSLVAARVAICAGHQALAILQLLERMEMDNDGR